METDKVSKTERRRLAPEHQFKHTTTKRYHDHTTITDLPMCNCKMHDPKETCGPAHVLPLLKCEIPHTIEKTSRGKSYVINVTLDKDADMPAKCGSPRTVPCKEDTTSAASDLCMKQDPGEETKRHRSGVLASDDVMHARRCREPEQRRNGKFTKNQNHQHNGVAHESNHDDDYYEMAGHESDDQINSNPKKLLCPTGMHPKGTGSGVSCQNRIGAGHGPLCVGMHAYCIASAYAFLRYYTCTNSVRSSVGIRSYLSPVTIWIAGYQARVDRYRRPFQQANQLSVTLRHVFWSKRHHFCIIHSMGDNGTYGRTSACPRT